MSDIYHSGPTTSIGVPTYHAHYENGAFSTPGGGSHGVTLPMPTDLGMPGLTANYVRGPTHSSYAGDGVVQQTNQFFTHSVLQNLGECVKGDTAYGLPTFIEHTPPSLRVEHQRMNALKMYGLPMWNHRMKYDPNWREIYGSQLSICEVMKKFGIIGIQQSRETMISLGDANKWCHANNFYIKGRARVPNIWLAEDKRGCIGELDVLYLVFRRHRFVGDSRPDNDVDMLMPQTTKLLGKRKPEDVRSNESRQRKWQPTQLELDLEREREDPNRADKADYNELVRQYDDQKAAFDDRDNATVEVEMPKVKLVPEGVKKDQYYWSCEPWTSHDKRPPPPALYNGTHPDNLFIGDYRHIGQVIHVLRGPNNHTQANVTLARDVLCPEFRDDSYLAKLYDLDEIELSVGCGRCFT